MRVLVLGATGYVGSRLVPALLAAGHEVIASSSSEPAPDRFAWGHQAEWRRCDIGDRAAVDRAVTGVDAVYFLVHSLQDRRFADKDRAGAVHVRDAADAAGVRRVVYLSGLVPTLRDGERQSEHMASRLEVEQILLAGRASTLSLRAGVVIGAGSTSYEVIRQLASILVVQPVPRWLSSRVQPVAVSDVLRALVGSLDSEVTGALDVGGPDALAYRDLLAAYSRSAGLARVQVPAPTAPTTLVGMVSALLVAAPFWTVTALVQSLRHDMVCRPDAMWEPADGTPLLGVDEALALAAGAAGDDVPERPLPSDAAWTRMRAPVLDELRAPAVVRAGASLALRRVAMIRDALR